MLNEEQRQVLRGDFLGRIIEFKHRGSFKHAKRFFENNSRRDYVAILRKYGEIGVAALAAATPTDSGKTASKWSYTITRNDADYTITWSNSNRNDGLNVVVLIQMGHGTNHGAYVKPVDFVNPALKDVFGDLARTIWNEVRSS